MNVKIARVARAGFATGAFVGAFPLEVHSWGIDALACAGHKWLCAGFGAGFVYVSRALLEKASDDYDTSTSHGISQGTTLDTSIT